MTYKIEIREGRDIGEEALITISASTPAEVLELVRELKKKRPYRKATKTADAEQAASPDDDKV